MRMFFIRHGETTGDVEDRFGGAYDDALSPEGENQCRALAEELAGKGLKVLYVSPLLRARQTAEFVAAASASCPVHLLPEVGERNQYGPLTGLTKAEGRASHPEWVEALKDRYFTLPGAESYEAFEERVVKGVESLLSQKSEGPIGVVWHGGPMRVLFRRILNLGELEKIGDCCWAEVDFTSPEPRLLATTRLQRAG